MEIKKNIMIEFSEADVKAIIADFLKKDGYNVTSNDVRLVVGSRLEGYGMAEHLVHYFEGAFVKCN